MSNLYPNIRHDPVAALVFYVGSRSEAGVERVVDLEAYNGNGACNCPKFEIFMKRHLENGAKPDRRLQCWHIIEATKELGHITKVAVIKARKRPMQTFRQPPQRPTLPNPPQPRPRRDYYLRPA